MEDGEVPVSARLPKFKFRGNLANAPASAPISYGPTEIPDDCNGLLFPYIQELTKFDRRTVPTVIKKYFLALLGDDDESVHDAFQRISAAWGNITNTEFGNKMAHIFKVLDISLSTQTCFYPVMSLGQYDGCIMFGFGYSLSVNGKYFEPGLKKDYEQEIPKMSSHSDSLLRIVQKFDCAPNRAETLVLEMRSSVDLYKFVQSHRTIAVQALVTPEIMKLGEFLAFPEDRLLDTNMRGIVDALSYISNASQPVDTLPSVHYTQLFETGRIELAMSAFGNSAPSFRVPGGKRMLLTEPFRVSGKEKGAIREVTKIATQTVPLSIAIAHLKETIQDKAIMNPWGNSVPGNSNNHLNRTFEKESCENILTALRSVAAVTVADRSAGKKRARGDDDEDTRGKKRRVDDW
jgi:hypothetical protein